MPDAVASQQKPEMITLDLPHLRVSALAWGPTDGRLALCQHGFPDSAWSWQAVAPRMVAEGFRVVAPFSRGYHPTDIPADGDFSVSALMYDMIEIHRFLGSPDDAILVGHDWGAFTTNALAAYPDSPFATHVVMSVPSIAAMRARRRITLDEVALSLRQVRNSWYILFFQLPFLPERVVDRLVGKMWRDWSVAAFDVRGGVTDTRRALPSVAHRRAAVSYYRALARPGRPDARYAHLHPYRYQAALRPILHLQGAGDGAIDVRYSDLLSETLPKGSAVEILSGGHFLQCEQPVEVSDAITRFVNNEKAMI